MTLFVILAILLGAFGAPFTYERFNFERFKPHWSIAVFLTFLVEIGGALLALVSYTYVPWLVPVGAFMFAYGFVLFYCWGRNPRLTKTNV
jgi:hypothetical protein